MVDDFDAWYAATRPRLAPAVALWCGDPALAADAVDEAFVRAYERWDRVQHMASPAGWVWQTVRNVVRRQERRRAIEARLLRRQAASLPPVATDAGVDDLDLVDGLRRLSQRQQTALVLYYVADLPVRDVAAAMGVAEGTVHATLHQGRRRLAEVLDAASPDGEQPSTAALPTDGALP